MGCTDSSLVAQTKPKPVFSIIDNSKFESDHIMMGEIQQNKFVCMSIVAPKSNNQPLQICQRMLPQIAINQKLQKFKPPNFAQMTRISQTNLYIITGGINFKLDQIQPHTYLYNLKQNRIFKLPALKQLRYTHSAVYFDGFVYVMGGRYFGEDDQALLNKCEKLFISIKEDLSSQQIFNFIKQQNLVWKQMASMNKKRCSQLSVIYCNKIYTIGGYTGQYQRSPLIEFYDLQQKQGAKWNVLSVALPFGIQSFIGLANNNNQLTIFGGNTNSGPTGGVLTINLFQGYESIHSNKQMQSNKILHKIVKNQLNIYIIGGNPQMEIEQYKIQSQQKEDKTTLNEHNIYQKNNKSLIDKKTLSKYFKSVEEFQALTYSQNSIIIPFSKQLPESPYEKSQNDQIVYVFGTSSQPFVLELNISVPYASYNAVPLSIKLFALQGVVYLPQTKQYLLFGGISDSQQNVSDQTYIYNPNNSNQSNGLVAKMTIPKYAFGYQKIGNYVYAVGGGSCDEQGQLIILKKCQRLDLKKLHKPNSKTVIQWTSISDLPLGLISPMTLNYNNNLYVFGGMRQNKQRYKNILKYKQKQNAWQQLKFSFPFGLQASSIYHSKQNQFLIFGGRVVNGDTNNIWGLTFISNGQDCVFEEKGAMTEPKCLHHVYKPKNQKFIVILGGEKEFLSFYDCQNLKPIESDILLGMKKLFTSNLSTLRDRTLKNYTVALQE